ncbi:alpha/beta fold hydrolase [Rhodococcus globerulus]|uniref:Alpha/beta hydrolase n=1 Tax=Rhodococcus globerulus TaxID=33008 RepID=A0ABU4C003_RHOGO|nr:alpha/beta hydrolase [Rhodococcus globerulus]MDV6269649.1 alpha/beta hydrolase [Rhodococcus globerulus]
MNLNSRAVASLAACTTLILGGCSNSTSPEVSSTTASPSNGDFAGLVDIGDGRSMYLTCKGTGSPTVVFVSGRTDRADVWKTVADPNPTETAVFDGVAETTRVCAYDRPGTVTITGEQVDASRSTPVPQPTTAEDGMRDLHALLSAADVPGPYVLVAHSWGGLIARLYADTYPTDIDGLVLVDTLTELLYDGLTPQEQQWWLTLNSNYSPDLEPYNQEKSNLEPSFQSLRDAGDPPPMPVGILVSDQPFNLEPLSAAGELPPGIPVDFGPTIFAAHIAGQQALAERLHAHLDLDTDAGHYVHTEQPALTTDAIDEVVDAARTNPDQWFS